METGASLRVTSTERLRDGTFKGFLDLDKVIEMIEATVGWKLFLFSEIF